MTDKQTSKRTNSPTERSDTAGLLKSLHIAQWTKLSRPAQDWPSTAAGSTSWFCGQ